MLLDAWRVAKKGPREKLVEDVEECVDWAIEELYSDVKILERLKVIKSKLEVVYLDRMGNTEGFVWFSNMGLRSNGR